MEATERELEQFWGREAAVEERKVHEATKRHEDAFDLDDLFDTCVEHEAVILHCIQKQQYKDIGELFVKQREAVVTRRVNLELGLSGGLVNALDARFPTVMADLAALSIKGVQA